MEHDRKNLGLENLNVVKLEVKKRRQPDAAATPKLCSTSFGFNKNRAAVKINKHKKTKISIFVLIFVSDEDFFKFY